MTLFSLSFRKLEFRNLMLLPENMKLGKVIVLSNASYDGEAVEN
jgi:hypothetical protein